MSPWWIDTTVLDEDGVAGSFQDAVSACHPGGDVAISDDLAIGDEDGPRSVCAGVDSE